MTVCKEAKNAKKLCIHSVHLFFHFSILTKIYISRHLCLLGNFKLNFSRAKGGGGWVTAGMGWGRVGEVAAMYHVQKYGEVLRIFVQYTGNLR